MAAAAAEGVSDEAKDAIIKEYLAQMQAQKDQAADADASDSQNKD